jgi:hypothetical protein
MSKSGMTGSAFGSKLSAAISSAPHFNLGFDAAPAPVA